MDVQKVSETNREDFLQPCCKLLLCNVYTKQTAALNDSLLFKHSRLCASPPRVNASSSKQTWTAAGVLQTQHSE